MALNLKQLSTQIGAVLLGGGVVGYLLVTESPLLRLPDGELTAYELLRFLSGSFAMFVGFLLMLGGMFWSYGQPAAATSRDRVMQSLPGLLGALIGGGACVVHDGSVVRLVSVFAIVLGVVVVPAIARVLLSRRAS